MRTEQIDAYQVRFGVQQQGRYDTYIELFNASGTHVGLLKFYEGDPPSEFVSVFERRLAILMFPRSHFQDIYTLLRKEQPVYLHVWEFESYGYLSTSREPEGEEDPSSAVHARRP